MADGAADVCICVLFYGAEDKHYKLAERVLNEPMRCLAKRNIEFRFGCNAVGSATTSFLQRQIAEHFHNAVLFHSATNIMKYPMMRQMLHQPPIRAPITLWFDHDSYFPEDHQVDDWFNSVMIHLNGRCDMIGSVQKAKLSDDQAAWVATQPWFNSDCDKLYLSYATGGWWAVKTEILRRFDWPHSTLQQKGGDVILGALFKHQNLSICHFRGGLQVSANSAGVEAAASTAMD